MSVAPPLLASSRPLALAFASTFVVAAMVGFSTPSLGAASLSAVAASPPPGAGAPAQPAADTLTWVVAEEGNEARYRVREQLARLDFPNDAVGVTLGVQGRIVLDEGGQVVREASRFVIDLAGLASDSDRRDNFLRRNTLSTSDHPDAVFVPTAIRGLPNPIPESGEASVVMEGQLTIREATRPVEWDVELEFWEGAVIGQARTRFTFGDFDLEVPSVGSVLSIRDDIRLEYDFRLVPAG